MTLLIRGLKAMAGFDRSGVLGASIEISRALLSQDSMLSRAFETFELPGGRERQNSTTIHDPLMLNQVAHDSPYRTVLLAFCGE